MKNRRTITRIVSILLSCVIVLSSPVRVFASDKDSEDKSFRGRLPVYCMDNNGNQFWLDVYSEDDRLYVESNSFAKKFGYLTAETETSVQFLQCENKEGEEYRWMLVSDFKINSDRVWLMSDGKTAYYKAPYKCLKKDDEIFIPLQFALKIMGREMIVNEGFIVVSCPHESRELILESCDSSNTPEMLDRSINYLNSINLGYETKSDSLMPEALASKKNKYDWLYSKITDPEVKGDTNEDGLNELATYLVANVSPESQAYMDSYYEMAQMYMSPSLMLAGVDVAGSLIYELSAQEYGENVEEAGKMKEESIVKGMAVVEESAATVKLASPATLEYNDAFKEAYTALTGYNPITEKWENETVYPELMQSLYNYSGDPDDGIVKTLTLGLSFIPYVSTAKNSIASIYATNKIVVGALAENEFASERFENYLDNNSSKDEKLKKALRGKINNYTEYQAELIEKYLFEAVKKDVEGYAGGKLDKELGIPCGGTEILQIAGGKELTEEEYGAFTVAATRKIVQEEIPLSKLFFLPQDIQQYCTEMEEIADKRLKKSKGAYLHASAFANEIRINAYNKKNIDWAYCYFKADYTAKRYYLSVLSKTFDLKGLSALTEDDLRMDTLLNEAIKEDCYHMAEIRTGIMYGLSEEDNEAYNAVYDDTALLGFVEEVNLSLGNTNGNINSYGIITTSEEHVYYNDFLRNYSVHMTNSNGSDDKVIINEPGFWLNAICTDEKEYLYYINDSSDICVYDVSNSTKKTICQGNFNRLMIAYGYLFAVENGTLYRFVYNGDDALTERHEIVQNVGSCIVYQSDEIYYSSLLNELCRCNFDGEETEGFGIYTSSFDIANGTVYYSDNNDSRRIHSYNLITEKTSTIQDAKDTYGLIYYSGMIYYKVDSDISSGMVYAAMPPINRQIVRVYTPEIDPNKYGGANERWVKANAFGNDTRRIFNISNGKIVNEGYFRVFVKQPVVGVNFNTLWGYLGNLLSKMY
ncbi:MAG: hypothetical protein J6X80_07920 [Lachnospiraceae bacterium]|nr:hypothetical protein [Lachnospiraceae bacterium]